MRKIVVENTMREGMFLSDYIRFVYPGAPEEAVFLGILRSDIILNGKPARRDETVFDGDTIELNLLFFHLGLAPVLDILYEDESFIAIEKMPGIKSFDEKRSGEINVYDLVLEYMLQKGEYSVESLTVPYLCYTLPETAGGILLIAKYEEAYRFIVTALAQRRIKTLFEAIVFGGPAYDKGEEYHYIDSSGKFYTRPNETSVACATRLHVLRRIGKCSVLRAEPITFLKDQVNAHTAFLGFPVVGDPDFGNRRINKKYYTDYQALWLTQLKFTLGGGHMFEYLNQVTIQMDEITYPNNLTKERQ